jgi:hypothetical protein
MNQLYDLGVRWIEVVDDDMVVMGWEMIYQLVLEVESGRCHRMEIYIHAGMRSIHDFETLELLHRLGVTVIQTGFETADPDLKKLNANKATLAEEDQFVEWCGQLGIALHPSAVIGLEGETYQTMTATFQRLRDLAKKVRIYGVQVDPIVVLPGCADWQKLMKVCPEFGETDVFDVESVTRTWLQCFTTITLEQVIDLYNQVIPQIPAQAKVGWHLRRSI